MAGAAALLVVAGGMVLGVVTFRGHSPSGGPMQVA
ncbi:MAG: hypothetical protein JWP40_4037 [Blastococcus sp.]|jgi:hypothetical protein|nr:hypothetical protein [Blastococcus sp.]